MINKNKMKRKIKILMMLALMASCGQKTKEQQIQELKEKLVSKQNAAADIKAEIEKIETELAKLGGKEAIKGTPVEVAQLDLSPFKNYLEVMGKVDAEESVSVSSEIPGTIIKIHVETGSMVSKGQVLAETDNRVMQQTISDLELNLDLINTLYEKQKSLWDQKIGTEVQFLQVKNQKESMEKKIAIMQEQLKMTRIVSPIDGIVDAVDIKVGSAVAPGLPAIRVVNMSKLKIKAEVAEKFASQIKSGKEVRVILPDMNDSLETKISYASKTINPMNRTFTIEINLPGKNDYHPNMFARLKITTYTSATSVISIPVKLIQRDGTNEYVMLKKGDKAEKRIIKTGQSYNGITEIVSGLNPGESIIVNGQVDLQEGEVVYVTK